MRVNPSTFIWRRNLSLNLISILLISSSAFGWHKPATASLVPELTQEERDLAAKVKLETIRDVVTSLSSDEMQGRGTAQPGGDKAAGFLADRFAALGLKPLGNKNSYLQPIKFRDVQFLPDTSLKVGDETLKLGTDFAVGYPYSEDKNASGGLVFVAYGLSSTIPKRDDLKGISVKGQMVVLLSGPPQVVSKEAWKKAKIQYDIIKNLISLGAAGLIFIDTGREEHRYSEMADYAIRRQVAPSTEEEPPTFLPPFISASDATAEKLFAASGLTRAQALAKAEQEGFTPINLKQSAKITVRLKKSKGVGNNVVGLLEGSDPKLKEEALVYSAHYDAYGLSADNRIYHGAADNGLGVGEMLAIAEAFSHAATKPRRSIIFLAVTGEEYGGYGSDYWVHNPTWKIKQVAADLNFDGMGTEVYGPVKVLVGYGAEHSTLGALMNDVALASDLKVIPDPMPDEHSFYRSDHYFFVKKGIPGLMILGAPDGPTKAWVDRMKEWEKTDYHQPTDTVRPDWNWEGPRTLAILGVVMGMRLANSEAMPAWLSTSPFNRDRGTNAEPPAEP